MVCGADRVVGGGEVVEAVVSYTQSRVSCTVVTRQAVVHRGRVHRVSLSITDKIFHSLIQVKAKGLSYILGRLSISMYLIVSPISGVSVAVPVFGV